MAGRRALDVSDNAVAAMGGRDDASGVELIASLDALPREETTPDVGLYTFAEARASVDSSTEQDAGTASRPVDGLGDHAVARYRHFRNAIESMKPSEIDEVLFGLLLSAESIRDEMRAYEEEVSWLLRLVQTGHSVRQIRRLHGVLDAMSSQYDMKEPASLNEWEKALEQERSERVERYDVLLGSVSMSDIESQGVGCTLLSEIESEEQQEEVLTLLKAAINEYGDDVLTSKEIEVTKIAFQAVAEISNMIVVSLPSWLVMPFEFHSTFGLSRWGNDKFVPEHSDTTQFIDDADEWSRLNHPHVAKFLGACHVGNHPFIVHERVRTLSEYVHEVKDRQQVWRRLYEVALALQYLRERGLSCGGRLGMKSVYCAELEAKAMLFGAGLVSVGDSGELRDGGSSQSCPVLLDIEALSVLILNCLRMASSRTDGMLLQTRHDAASDGVGGSREFSSMPTSRPDFVKESEWVILTEIRQVDVDSPAVILHVIEHLKTLAEVPVLRDPFGNPYDWEETFAAMHGVIQIGSVLMPRLDCCIGDVLTACNEMAENDEVALRIQKRLADICSQARTTEMCQTGGAPGKELIMDFVGLLDRLHRLLEKKTGCSDSFSNGWSVSKPESTFSLHMDIDRFMDTHNLSRSDEVHSWKPDWKLVRAKHQLMALSELVIHPSLHPSRFHHAETSSGCLRTSDSVIAHTEAVPEHAQLANWFLAPTEIEFKSYTEFSRGSFGSVHRGWWFDTPVVVKRTFMDTGDRDEIQAQFIQEAKTWFQLNHINIVKMYGACHIGAPFFVCEYASGGDLSSFLSRNNREPYLIWYSLLNAALGLQYLHDKGFVHADLKANNILVGSDGIAKLTDFGLSVSGRDSGGDEGGGALGAYRWKAPECIPWDDEPGKAATFASDVYSFAMVMIEVASGTYPWGTVHDGAVPAYSKKGDLPLRPTEIGDSEWHLIERMCCLDPSERVTINAVVVHLSSLLERLKLARLRSPIDGGLEPINHKNRVLSRGGAMLSLIGLANSKNTRLSWYATEHLVAVQVNRETHSEKREIDAMVWLLENGSDQEKTWAGRAFMKLSSNNRGNEDELLLIAACGGIPPLVALIRDGNGIQGEDAVGALLNLSVNEDNQVAIASCGSIPLLVALVRDGDDIQKENAAAALNNLAVNDANKALIASSGAIPLLVSLMSSDIDAHRVKAVGALGNLSGDAENSLLISECGGIPLLVMLARDGNDALKEKAAAALANLSTNHNI